MPLSGFMLATVIIVAGFIGYFYYESSVPGTLRIALYPAGYDGKDAFKNSTILQVLANFTEVQVHAAGQSNRTGWHILMQTRNPFQLVLTKGACPIYSACVFWTSRLAPGSYDFLKFNTSNIVINIERIGNVSYTLAGGGFEPLIVGYSSFIVQPNQEKSLLIQLKLSSAEVYARNGYLHATSIEILS
jgi:hypothetical protein